MIELSEIRHEAGVTQAEMAARLSTTQGSVSQLERRGDVLLSTLSEYLTALGAQARITVTIGERTFEHVLTADQVASSAESAPVDSAPRAASPPDQRADAGVDYAALAQALVDAGATTKPAAVVASILSAHADGTALNRIASDMGIHHKTVSRIIDAAENYRQRLRVAV